MDNTTNNRMELTALISALKVLKEEGLELKIFSDSSYVINCFKSNWHIKWKQNGWKNSKKEPVENQDLWMELLDLLEKQEPTFYLVKGHVKIPKESDFSKFIEHNGKEFTFADFAKIIEYNNRCDELATRYQRGL